MSIQLRLHDQLRVET